MLTKIKRRKGNWKKWRKGQARSQIPAYTAFNMAVGWKPITLWVRRGWANFKVKTYGLKKKLFCFTVQSMQKKQATKLEQLKHLKASQERAKTRRGSEVTKGFQTSKGTKTPKARPGYIICLPTSNTYQRSPLLNNETSQQSNISIF